ncbi:MAG TPA: alpha-E domain-containing protein, partial [Dongiaceae bacterium]|nr:alpha-E domain-containing protein [Dongiaceae bacterium]
SLTAYQMYRQSMQARVRRGDVLKFLFQSKKFPRSIFFCAQQLEQCVLQLPNFDTVLTQIHQLMDMVQDVDLESFDQNQLHEFIDQCQIEFNSIHGALVDNYFLSGRIYRQVPKQVQKAS